MQGIEKVVLIGSGNVATQLAQAFYAKGLKIEQVYSRNLNHAKELATIVDSDSTDSLKAIYPDADLYIIAVKDDAIGEINAGLRLPGRMVVHTSGSANVDALGSVSLIGGALYPLQTFTKVHVVNWGNVPVIINGMDEESTALLREFAIKISSHVYEFNEEERKRIHVAAVFANNFVNYILGEAKTILGENIPFSILEPLVRETVGKAFSHGTENSQTGPAKRGDMKTIEAHIKLLENLPNVQYIYQVITDAIIEKYKE